MFLSDLSIKQPVLATMLAVTLVVLGVYSYRELSVDLMPNVEIPVLTVQTAYPGASPETVEREVTKRIEEALNTIPGVRHITSTTTEGLSHGGRRVPAGRQHHHGPAGRAGQDQRHPRRLSQGHGGARHPAPGHRRHADRVGRGGEQHGRHQDALFAGREGPEEAAGERVRRGPGEPGRAGPPRGADVRGPGEAEGLRTDLRRSGRRSAAREHGASRRASWSRARTSRWCAWPASSAPWRSSGT